MYSPLAEPAKASGCSTNTVVIRRKNMLHMIMTIQTLKDLKLNNWFKSYGDFAGLG